MKREKKTALPSQPTTFHTLQSTPRSLPSCHRKLLSDSISSGAYPESCAKESCELTAKLFLHHTPFRILFQIKRLTRECKINSRRVEPLFDLEIQVLHPRKINFLIHAFPQVYNLHV